jgi:hypothetical protein
MLGFLLVGPLFLVVLAVLAYIHFKLSTGGISGFISDSFALKPIRQFGMQFGLRMLLPLYFGAGALAWVCSMIPGALARPHLLRDWRGGEALGLGLSAMLWAHLVLWWQVPTAFWVIPGLRAIPFVVLFPLLALLALAYPVDWLARLKTAGLPRRGAVLVLWILLWTGMALAPQWLPRPKPESRGGDQPCRMLILGVDALRSDTFLASSGGFQGIRYRNAYTVIPATRLLWHMLWGGDAMTYTIGHVAPSMEEFNRPHDLKLLSRATAQGWKPRFYIDDGGTIGTAGRRMDLDDLLMPAAGWENFVNSNLAVNFPLYAVWENLLKPFPTTNPWATMDGGLKEALRLGRGSGWVMYHSCLAHQPIFLTRPELHQTGRWWTLAPRDYEPRSNIGQVTAADVKHMEPRTNTFLGYQIRMRSILEAWKPIWNALARDPQYKDAVRVLFSDHGERFHQVANGFQLQGVHGFNLDPWECRATMLVSGHGFSDAVNAEPRDATISLLGLRDGISRLLDGATFDAHYFETCTPRAPFRYHTLATDAFGAEAYQYRAEPETDLAVNTYLAPGGIWFTQYSKSAKERAEDASIGYGVGPLTTYIKPLQGGGAMESVFREYQMVSEHKIDEAAFRKAKQDVEQILTRDDEAMAAGKQTKKMKGLSN